MWQHDVQQLLTVANFSFFVAKHSRQPLHIYVVSDIRSSAIMSWGVRRCCLCMQPMLCWKHVQCPLTDRKECVCVSTYPGSGQGFLYMLHCPITRFRPAFQVVPGIPPCLSLPASCMVSAGTQLRVVCTGWLQLVKRESTPTWDIRTHTLQTMRGTFDNNVNTARRCSLFGRVNERD